jgi:hypothetical protein
LEHYSFLLQIFGKDNLPGKAICRENLRFIGVLNRCCRKISGVGGSKPWIPTFNHLSYQKLNFYLDMREGDFNSVISESLLDVNTKSRQILHASTCSQSPSPPHKAWSR